MREKAMKRAKNDPLKASQSVPWLTFDRTMAIAALVLATGSLLWQIKDSRQMHREVLTFRRVGYSIVEAPSSDPEHLKLLLRFKYELSNHGTVPVYIQSLAPSVFFGTDASIAGKLEPGEARTATSVDLSFGDWDRVGRGLLFIASRFKTEDERLISASNSTAVVLTGRQIHRFPLDIEEASDEIKSLIQLSRSAKLVYAKEIASLVAEPDARD